MTKKLRSGNFATNLWSKTPKEIRVAGYIGLSAGVWGFIRALGAEYEGDTLAIALINLLIVLLENRLPEIKQKLKK